jgi:hypothetical protein
MQLVQQCPVLHQICNLVDTNFYQFLRKRGNIVRLSKTCIKGLTVDVGSRREYSLLFLVAAPDRSKEPGNSMHEGVRSMGRITS